MPCPGKTWEVESTKVVGFRLRKRSGGNGGSCFSDGEFGVCGASTERFAERQSPSVESPNVDLKNLFSFKARGHGIQPFCLCACWEMALVAGDESFPQSRDLTQMVNSHRYSACRPLRLSPRIGTSVILCMLIPTSIHSVKTDVIEIMVADSNQMRLQLLVNALRRRREFRITGCELEVASILKAIGRSPAEVIIVNLDRPGNSSPEMSLVRRLHVAHPNLPQIVLLDGWDHGSVVSAFRSGARGIFCFSESPFALLCKCIHCVHRGEIWANNEQVRSLVHELAQVPSLRTVNANGMKLLTPREEQVVALIADGLSNRAAAVELSLSENTVKKYLFHIFDKLGISSRVELVLFAVSHGEHRPAEWVAGQPQ